MIIALALLLSVVFLFIKKNVLMRKYKSKSNIVLKYDCQKFIDVFFVFIGALCWILSIKNNWLNGISIIIALCIVAVFFITSKSYFYADENILISYKSMLYKVTNVKICYDKRLIYIIFEDGSKKIFRSITQKQFESLCIQVLGGIVDSSRLG